MQEMLRKHYPYVIIVVATLLVYLPFIGNGFINIDDAGLIWNNSAVTQFDIPRIFTTFDPELYIPLTLLTYQIEYLIAGAAPTLVHATNLLLHILSALLVFSIIKKLTRNATIGLLTALLFAVHPMQGTAVLWASARKDLLSSALMLLSLHLYLRENKWSVLTFACALLSKISVAVLPVLLLLVDVWEGKPMNRDRIIEKWPYFGLSLVFGIIAIVGKTSNLGSLSVVDYLLLSAKNIVFSAQKLFVPTDLSIMYTQGGEVSILAPDFFVPVILILVIAVALFLLRKKQPVLLWCVAWFAVCMAPNLLTYVQNNNIIFTSNRYVYLACIGVFMYAATLIGLLKKGQTTLVSLVLVGVLGVFAVLHARTWSSSETLLRSALAAGYDHRMIHHNLGAALRSQDKTDEALQEFLIAGKAGNPHSYKLAGDMYGEQGNTQEKMRLYQLGMDTARKHGAYGSTDLSAHFAIGGMLLHQGRIAQAEDVFLETVKLGDHIASTHINLGSLYIQQHKFPLAKEHLIRATQINRFSADAWNQLGYVYGQEGEFDAAASALKRVLRVNPDYEGARVNLDQLLRM